MAHSAGEWEIDLEGREPGEDIEVYAGKVMIALVNTTHILPTEEGEEEVGIANARLIASVPELLAALAPLADWDGREAPPLAVLRKWASDALLAVEKARGD